jgi:hypothetical protein
MRSRPLYATAAYAQAFGGQIIDVPEWRTALLRRAIADTGLEDARGCYPLSLIEPEADLMAGLQRLRTAKLVSVSLVPDPITGPGRQNLASAFPICRPFKTHYVIDRASESVRLPRTHLRWIRKALRECDIRIVPFSASLGDWIRLYGFAIERHAISGLQKFSPEYFNALAQLPGLSAIAAFAGREIVAMALWVQNAEVVYYHLGASDHRGYESRAMYGIFATAQEHFSSARLFHLGGAAGLTRDENDGLARFKRGFANREVEAYFCGAVLDPERYAALSAGREQAAFFPAYRES